MNHDAQLGGTVTVTQNEYERLKTMLYHVVSPNVAQEMTRVRRQYLVLALDVLRSQSPSRSQSLALTALEDSLMRAIQSLALQGTPQLPDFFEVLP